MAGKTKAAALQAVEDYIKTEAFLTAIDEVVEKAIDKHITRFIDRLDTLEKANTGLTERMDGIDGKSLELETSLTARKTEIKSLNGLIEAQATSINNLKLAMNEAEQYSRRNCLKIYGVKESDSENTDEIICRLATERLGVLMVTTDLDRSHRIAPRSNNALAGNSRELAYRRRRGSDIHQPVAPEGCPEKRQGQGGVVLRWGIVILLPATNGKTTKRTIHSKEDIEKL